MNKENEFMKQGEKIKNYCNKCRHETWHNILFVKMISDSTDDFSWGKEYTVLQCAGCDEIWFRTEYSDSESYDIDEFGNFVPNIVVENYPPLKEGTGDIENFFKVPYKIKDIYSETLKAIMENCLILAGIGLRATIEVICEYEKIDGKNLLTKINKMASKGIISKDEAKDLHAIRFLGNDAAHDGKAPEKFQIILALRIIQHLIGSRYALQDEIEKYLELPISTYEEFKIFLEEKIKKQSPEKTFSIRLLIGKDKRRIEEYESYMNQYEQEIQNGKIDFLEDITSQIPKDNKSEKNKVQRIYRRKKNTFEAFNVENGRIEN